MFSEYYRNRRVFVTGHSGFKGSWLSYWLHSLGAEVFGYSLEPSPSPNLHEITAGPSLAREWFSDIRDFDNLRKAVKECRPEICFHLAAQPLVRESYRQPRETLEVNVMGTANLLDAFRAEAPDCPLVVITTDKCYENRNWLHGYREEDRLGGHDVYSMSKASAELVAASWRSCFSATSDSALPIATARAGNVVGGGDYGIDRIVPDLVRSLIEGRPLEVRSPKATRPWQHVLDCLSGYLCLGAKLGKAGPNSEFDSAFNFGPDRESHQTVESLVQCFFRTWQGEWRIVPQSTPLHEAHWLHLSIDKSAQLLDWRPTWTFEEAIEATASWYRARHHLDTSDMLTFCHQQLDQYLETARKCSASWIH